MSVDVSSRIEDDGDEACENTTRLCTRDGDDELDDNFFGLGLE